MDRRIALVLIAALIVSFVFLFWLTHRDPGRPTTFPSSSPTTATTTAPRARMVSDICLSGCPTGAPPSDQIVIHHVLILANNPNTKFSDWVAYRITRETVGAYCKRRWSKDPDIKARATLAPRDYFGLRNYFRFDRGHQAPLASLCGSPHWQEVNYLSNITPQKADLNEGAWKRLEGAERSLISRRSAGVVYSVTGPLYERRMAQLPNAHTSHTVPSGYWKIIAIADERQILAAAFIMDQGMSRDANYCSTVTTVREVQRRVHLTFFSKLTHTARAGLDSGTGRNNLIQALGCP